MFLIIHHILHWKCKGGMGYLHKNGARNGGGAWFINQLNRNGWIRFYMNKNDVERKEVYND